MIEYVERLCLQLYGETLGDLRVLEHRQISRVHRLPAFRVSGYSQKWRAEIVRRVYIVDDPVRLAHGNRISRVHADQPAISRGRIRTLPHRPERSAAIPEDRTASIKYSTGKVRGVAQTLAVVLQDRPGLSAGVAISSVDLPPAQQTTERSGFVPEGHVVDPEQAKDV